MNRAIRFLPALAALLAFLLAGCSHSAAPNVAATVNGRSITYADVDKQYESQFGAADRPSDDQVAIQRLEVLRTLIDNEVLLQRAEKEGLLAVDADVEGKFAELKAPYTQEEFQKKLNERKMTPEELKTQLRRELSVQKLLDKETTSKISITDKDIADFYQANISSFNLSEPQIHMAQILVTPMPNSNVRNLKNDKAQDDEQARKKIQSIYQRLEEGEDFAMLAQNYSEDPESASNGGDLGFVKESALEQANSDLRNSLKSLRPGQTSPVLHTPDGYRILKVISKEPAGQRNLNDPTVQQTIREQLINRKDQLLKAAYYEVARNEAKVVNYFADTVVANRDKK
jgi:peptidyl-prolyl cis-trans isomerase SurA